MGRAIYWVSHLGAGAIALVMVGGLLAVVVAVLGAP